MNDKICPIRSTYDCKVACMKDNCAWWYDDPVSLSYGRCAILKIAFKL